MKNSLLLSICICASTVIVAQTPVDETQILTIGGIQQFVRIKGKDRSKPFLLFLHGGPGGSVMNYADKFTSRLQAHFIVVQWDQRETGKTRQLNETPVALTVSVFQQDTRELMDTLLKKFNKPKLFLAGHSWGTYLGFQMAKNYPELIYAYIAISPMIHQAESERIILQLMKDRAKQTGNNKALEELTAVNIPFRNGEELYFHRKWMLDYIGSKAKLSRNFVLGWANTWLQVFNQASAENLMENLPSIKCPVYFCIGRKDYQTNFTLVEAYYNMIDAPKKDLFWFEHAAHSIPYSEPELLQQIIIDKVLRDTCPEQLK